MQTLAKGAAEATGRAREVAVVAVGKPNDPETAEQAAARKNHEAIIQGLLNGRIIWTDSPVADFWFYLKQTHVILGIGMAHGMHPYTRLARLSAWLASCTAGFGLSLLFLDQEGNKKSGAAVLAASTSVSVVLTIGNMIMVKSMTCACVQEGSCLFRLGGQRMRGGANAAGRCIAAVLWLFALAFLGTGLAVGLMHEVPFAVAAETFAISQLYSWALGVTTGFFLYLYSYWGLCCCLRGQGYQESRKGKAYPHGEDFPNDPEMMAGGDVCRCCAQASRRVAASG